MSEENVIFDPKSFNPEVGKQTDDGTQVWTNIGKEPTSGEAGLAEAAKKFEQQFTERSYGQRHEELGKMINCRLCGRRHRAGDPLIKESTAHGPQPFADRELPARTAYYAKQRINQRHNSRVHEFAHLAEKIYNEEIAPYFSAEGDKLIRRAQRQAAAILRKRWIAARVIKKHMQAVSRRINWGLVRGGSR